MKGINSPTEFEKHYHGYIKLPKITFEKKYTRVHVVLNNAQMHLRDNLKGFIHVFVCFIFFSFFSSSFLFFGAEFLSSHMEQLSRTALLSWDSLPSGYK